jgi:hypothetical protein
MSRYDWVVILHFFCDLSVTPERVPAVGGHEAWYIYAPVEGWWRGPVLLFWVASRLQASRILVEASLGFVPRRSSQLREAASDVLHEKSRSLMACSVPNRLDGEDILVGECVVDAGQRGVAFEGPSWASPCIG